MYSGPLMICSTFQWHVDCCQKRQWWAFVLQQKGPIARQGPLKHTRDYSYWLCQSCCLVELRGPKRLALHLHPSLCEQLRMHILPLTLRSSSLYSLLFIIFSLNFSLCCELYVRLPHAATLWNGPIGSRSGDFQSYSRQVMLSTDLRRWDQILKWPSSN